jgi:hypothetical protein
MILLLFFFPEQGHRNDLLTRHDGPVPQDPHKSIIINSTRTRSLLSTSGSPTNIISDTVHCNPLSFVASGSRCHTADYLKETKDAEDSLLCPMYCLLNPPSPGSMCSPSPVQTPPSTHSVPLLPLLMLFIPLYFIVIFVVRETSAINRIGSFKILSSPPTQVKMSTTEIDSEIIVFGWGGGVYVTSNTTTRWNSEVLYPCSSLHIEDKIRGDIGLSFPRIDGTSPFIRLPRCISL